MSFDPTTGVTAHEPNTFTITLAENYGAFDRILPMFLPGDKLCTPEGTPLGTVVSYDSPGQTLVMRKP